jgi:hypothetical protein
VNRVVNKGYFAVAYNEAKEVTSSNIMKFRLI